MLQLLQTIPVLILLVIATVLEASGDALVRQAIYQHTGAMRVAMFIGGAVLLFGYGAMLNVAPVEFGRIVGLYIATLFVVWQIINFAAYRTLPSLPVVIGGALIIAGGLVVTFWRPESF